jgi:hypothetical protein
MPQAVKGSGTMSADKSVTAVGLNNANTLK